MMLGDEFSALRKAMRVGRGDVGILQSGVRQRRGVKLDVDADTGEADQILRVDQGVKVRHDIPLDVVLPCDDAPTFAVLRGLHNLRHIIAGNEIESFGHDRPQQSGRTDRRLMRECALGPEIEQLPCIHIFPFLLHASLHLTVVVARSAAPIPSAGRPYRSEAARRTSALAGAT